MIGTFILIQGSARGVMVTAIGFGLGKPSSNPGWSYLHFTLC